LAGFPPGFATAKASSTATDRQVPVAGDKVTIARGQEVVLDVSPPALGGLSIDGKLTFASDADLELTTEWIMLHGELAIGSEASPHTRKATITLTDNVKGEEVMAGTRLRRSVATSAVTPENERSPAAVCRSGDHRTAPAWQSLRRDTGHERGARARSKV
jgi:hypothetical protein